MGRETLPHLKVLADSVKQLLDDCGVDPDDQSEDEEPEVPEQKTGDSLAYLLESFYSRFRFAWEGPGGAKSRQRALDSVRKRENVDVVGLQSLGCPSGAPVGVNRTAAWTPEPRQKRDWFASNFLINETSPSFPKLMQIYNRDEGATSEIKEQDLNIKEIMAKVTKAVESRADPEAKASELLGHFGKGHGWGMAGRKSVRRAVPKSSPKCHPRSISLCQGSVCEYSGFHGCLCPDISIITNFALKRPAEMRGWISLVGRGCRESFMRSLYRSIAIDSDYPVIVRYEGAAKALDQAVSYFEKGRNHFEKCSCLSPSKGRITRSSVGKWFHGPINCIKCKKKADRAALERRIVDGTKWGRRIAELRQVGKLRKVIVLSLKSGLRNALEDVATELETVYDSVLIISLDHCLPSSEHEALPLIPLDLEFGLEGKFFFTLETADDFIEPPTYNSWLESELRCCEKRCGLTEAFIREMIPGAKEIEIGDLEVTRGTVSIPALQKAIHAHGRLICFELLYVLISSGGKGSRKEVANCLSPNGSSALFNILEKLIGERILIEGDDNRVTTLFTLELIKTAEPELFDEASKNEMLDICIETLVALVDQVE